MYEYKCNTCFRQHLQAAADALVKSASSAAAEESTEDIIHARTEDIIHSPHVSKKKLTINDFLGYKFYPDFFNGTWISDTEILFMDQVGAFDTVQCNNDDAQLIAVWWTFGEQCGHI